MPLSYELRMWQEKIEGFAKEFGLDFYPTYFEMLSPKEINEFAALEGFPQRYPHWRFGMMYDQMSKGYKFGGQRIYEMVINNNPAYAYLMSTNPLVVNKTVMAHVYAHVDFFKNNRYFRKTNRKMIDEMANHATRIRRYIDRFGQAKVEEFLDKALSLDNLIDIGLIFIDNEDKLKDLVNPPPEPAAPNSTEKAPKLPKHMDSYLKEKQKKEEPQNKEDEPIRVPRNPARPISDILWYLIQYAPIEDWQKDIISIVREESYYFAPQMMTKIMNEGWAAFWHSKIMTEKALEDSEIIDFAEKNAEILRPSPTSINPYRLGIMLFRDILFRWDTGRFGREWEECTNMKERENWNKETNKGMAKIFEVRKIYNDVTFIDEFLTKEFVEEQLLYTYKYDRAKEAIVIDSKKYHEIKNKLLSQLTNMGQPKIELVDANFENRAELLLIHRHFGTDLNMPHAKATLENLAYIWTKPANLLTKIEDKGVLLRFDGREHSMHETEYDKWIEDYR